MSSVVTNQHGRRRSPRFADAVCLSNRAEHGEDVSVPSPKSPSRNNNKRKRATRQLLLKDAVQVDKVASSNPNEIDDEKSNEEEEEEEEEDAEEEDGKAVVYNFDGVQYSSYQEMVNAKRKRNQDILVQSGLLGMTLAARKTVSSKRKTTRRSSSSTQPATSSRKSKRLQGEKADGIFVQGERAGRFSFGTEHVGGGVYNGNAHDDVEKPPEFYGNRINDGADMTVVEAVQAIGEKWLGEDKEAIPHAQAFLQSIQEEQEQSNAVNLEKSPRSVVSTGLRWRRLSPSEDTKDKGRAARDAEDREEDTLSSAALLSHINRLSIGGTTPDEESGEVEEDYVCKVVPDRIYGITTHPSMDRLLVCAGDKQGYVGLWNATSRERHQTQDATVEGQTKAESVTLGAESDGVNSTSKRDEQAALHLFRLHTRPVTSIAWTADGGSMLTTSYDGTVRMWNAQTQTFSQVFAAYNDEEQFAQYPGHGLETAYGKSYWFQSACLDHRCSQDSSALFLSTSVGTVLHVDLRASPQTKINWNVQLSEKKINSVR